MNYYFHKNREIYFEHQRATTAEFIIPFIEQALAVTRDMTVLEVGCAEGGVLKAFTDRGFLAMGVDRDEGRLELGKRLMKEELEQGRLQMINRDIFEQEFKQTFQGRFDVIVLKDVIEHIEDQAGLLAYMHTFLKPGGVIFFSFPPWHMPFGGHQQTCDHKLLSVMPYFHLLPGPFYRLVLKAFGERDIRIRALLRLKRLGLSIGRFENILKQTGYQIIKRQLYLFNPIYKYKFKLKPRKQFRALGALPGIRNLVTTAAYYLVSAPEA